ncbi:gad-1 [Pristionchus pacificus]|uniref:Gad-1 n=1 Tax=Pristionchus pacificus TaxID=54126 RepID=A0A2A6C985_PRIPA|nr:gad-1 [Pristionchus pacificus]|eukprot:PDM74666.1 gad-1 [Pristionchus pacificus]
MVRTRQGGSQLKKKKLIRRPKPKVATKQSKALPPQQRARARTAASAPASSTSAACSQLRPRLPKVVLGKLKKGKGWKKPKRKPLVARTLKRSLKQARVAEQLQSVDQNDDDFIPMLPPGFKPDETVIVKDDDEKAKIKAAEGDEEEDDDEYEDYANGEGIPTTALIPTSCEAKIQHGAKPVSSLAFDHQGARIVSGGQDYNVNIYDFQKMDHGLRPDRQLTPCESHVIFSLAFNANGETLAIGSGAAQIRLLDRKGSQWAETVRGDQYLVDLAHTKGHTAAINCIVWNPLVKTEFLSASDDGSLRLWSTDDFKVITKCINTHQKVIKTKNANGKRAQPQSCAYSPDGKLIVCGCDDGSIQAWKHGKLFVNTSYLVRMAHSAPITCVVVAPDGKKILSRALDDTLKLWSLTDNKTPVLMRGDLECGFRGTDCGFSPRGEMVYTGTSAPSAEIEGKLLFLNAETFEPMYQIAYPGVSCIRIAWHARINQIAVGLSDGTVRMYYDQQLSHAGVMQCVTKPKKRQRQNEVLREELILSPLTLHMFQPRGDNPDEQEVTEWRIRKYLRMRDKQQRPNFKKPAEMPLDDKSCGGRVKTSGGTLHSYIAQQLGKEKNQAFLADTDVRASILKHAEAAEKDPQFINKAYMKNQPKPIFQEKSTAPEEEESDEELEPVYKMPRGQFSS